MELSQLMNWIGFVTGILIGAPQIVKTIKTKSARDLSAATFCLILITCICFFVRAIAIKEIALIFYYFFVICSCLLQLFLIWKFKDRNTQAAWLPGSSTTGRTGPFQKK